MRERREVYNKDISYTSYRKEVKQMKSGNGLALLLIGFGGLIILGKLGFGLGFLFGLLIPILIILLGCSMEKR